MSSVKKIEKKEPDLSSSPLDRLAHLTADEMQVVNQLIIDRMQSRVPLIPQLAGYIVANGGKRLRPLLTIAIGKLCGYQGQKTASLAACVEFIHTATLLHDDVVDESQLRRGQASANALFGNKSSVLVGDYLFSKAFELMVAEKSLPVLEVLSNASAVIAEGEVQQLQTTNDLETSEADYLEVIENKTAVLFRAACEVGAICAESSDKDKDNVANYGMALGVAFQLIDDALDYSAEQARLGKTVGDDFFEGKMTLPVILAVAQGTEDERRFWQRTIAELDQKDEDLNTAISLMDKYNTIDATVDRARFYVRKAKEHLKNFPDSELKQALLDVADFVVDRTN